MPRDVEAEKATRQARIGEAQRLHAEGVSIAQIAKQLGVAATTARGYIRDPNRKLGLTGRQNWRDIEPVETLHEPLWGRQPGESPQAYQAFERYREQDPTARSIQRAIGTYPSGTTKRSDWTKRWRWRERIEAYDRHMEDLAIRAQEKAIIDMRQRHAALAFAGLEKVMQRLNGDDDAGVTAINASLLSPQDLARLTEVMSKLEILARGAETERIDNTNQPVEIRLSFNATPHIRDVSQAFTLSEDDVVEEADELPELPPAA